MYSHNLNDGAAYSIVAKSLDWEQDGWWFKRQYNHNKIRAALGP